MEQTADRVAALVAEIGDQAAVGFHGHENLGLGVANTIMAIRAGALQVDGCTRRFGAGAGNTPTEALAAVCEKLGIRTGESTKDGRIHLKREEECLAACCGGPMMMVNHRYHENLTPEKVDEILDELD